MFIQPNWLGRLLRKPAIEVTQSAIRTTDQHLITFQNMVALPEIRHGWFGSSLTCITQSGRQAVCLLKTEQLKAHQRELYSRITPALEQRIAQLHDTFVTTAQKQYLRDSNAQQLKREMQHLEVLIQKVQNAQHLQLSEITQTQIAELANYYPLYDHLELLREEYEQHCLQHRQSFYDNVEANPLTKQQRLAVIRNNDYNLVLAAAGTGKTSVMVAKAIDLIDQGHSKPEEILVLAYNRSAAEELQERLSKRAPQLAEQPTISTFHALGRALLKAAKKSVHMSKFVDDPHKLNQWVTQWLSERLANDIEILQKVFSIMYQQVNPFDFDSQEEYANYIRDNEMRTLNDELVRGYQELLIANWLFVHGIQYKYEVPYVTKRRIAEGLDYNPDFYLPDADIYLEHFGIDHHGNTRPDIDKNQYNAEIEAKRELHREQGTTLVETFHYDWVEGNLESRLSKLMQEHGVALQPLAAEELLNVLNTTGFTSRLADILQKCLQAIRSEHLDETGIAERLKQANVDNTDWCAQFLHELHSDFQAELRNENAIDFDDMILLARQVTLTGNVKPKWRHILVDEFQDISMARLELIQALIDRGPQPTLTAVGDDWQSIYRFAGGKLEITTRFGEYLGAHTLTKLDKTFRYNNSIAHTAGTFVMGNPEQYQKHVQTHTEVREPQVYLLDTLVDGLAQQDVKVAKVVAKIRANDPNGSIAILSRYNYLLEQAKQVLQSQRYTNINYWTLHKAKGLEADYCIIVGFFQGKSGFPNENKEMYVVEALLPSLDQYPHSEERRLLYVGLTRARKKSYLIADPRGPSAFINELMAPKYDISIVSATFQERYQRIFKCPKCKEGFLRLQQGPYGDFYSCTTRLGCKVKPRVCKECGAPTIDGWFKSSCNNPECRSETPICDKCGRPMRLRKGKYGEFWGCSGYGLKHDRCSSTRPT